MRRGRSPGGDWDRGSRRGSDMDFSRGYGERSPGELAYAARPSSRHAAEDDWGRGFGPSSSSRARPDAMQRTGGRSRSPLPRRHSGDHDMMPHGNGSAPRYDDFPLPPPSSAPYATSMGPPPGRAGRGGRGNLLPWFVEESGLHEAIKDLVYDGFVQHQFQKGDVLQSNVAGLMEMPVDLALEAVREFMRMDKKRIQHPAAFFSGIMKRIANEARASGARVEPEPGRGYKYTSRGTRSRSPNPLTRRFSGPPGAERGPGPDPDREYERDRERDRERDLIAASSRGGRHDSPELPRRNSLPLPPPPALERERERERDREREYERDRERNRDVRENGHDDKLGHRERADRGLPPPPVLPPPPSRYDDGDDLRRRDDRDRDRPRPELPPQPFSRSNNGGSPRSRDREAERDRYYDRGVGPRDADELYERGHERERERQRDLAPPPDGAGRRTGFGWGPADPDRGGRAERSPPRRRSLSPSRHARVGYDVDRWGRPLHDAPGSEPMMRGRERPRSPEPIYLGRPPGGFSPPRMGGPPPMFPRDLLPPPMRRGSPPPPLFRGPPSPGYLDPPPPLMRMGPPPLLPMRGGPPPPMVRLAPPMRRRSPPPDMGRAAVWGSSGAERAPIALVSGFSSRASREELVNGRHEPAPRSSRPLLRSVAVTSHSNDANGVAGEQEGRDNGGDRGREEERGRRRSRSRSRGSSEGPPRVRRREEEGDVQGGVMGEPQEGEVGSEDMGDGPLHGTRGERSMIEEMLAVGDGDAEGEVTEDGAEDGEDAFGLSNLVDKKQVERALGR